MKLDPRITRIPWRTTAPSSNCRSPRCRSEQARSAHITWESATPWKATAFPLQARRLASVCRSDVSPSAVLRLVHGGFASSKGSIFPFKANGPRQLIRAPPERQNIDPRVARKEKATMKAEGQSIACVPRRTSLQHRHCSTNQRSRESAPQKEA